MYIMIWLFSYSQSASKGLFYDGENYFKRWKSRFFHIVSLSNLQHIVNLYHIECDNLYFLDHR